MKLSDYRKSYYTLNGNVVGIRLYPIFKRMINDYKFLHAFNKPSILKDRVQYLSYRKHSNHLYIHFTVNLSAYPEQLDIICAPPRMWPSPYGREAHDFSYRQYLYNSLIEDINKSLKLVLQNFKIQGNIHDTNKSIS